MIKKLWLVICHMAILLSLGLAQPVIAAPQATQSNSATSSSANSIVDSNSAPDLNEDSGNDDFDSNPDFDQDQSSGAASTSIQTENNSSGDYDEN